MKKYISPEIEIKELLLNDVLMASTYGDNDVSWGSGW